MNISEDDMVFLMHKIDSSLINKIISQIHGLSINDLIGKGGQKHVYSGNYLGNHIAFKVIIPDKGVLERVKREIRAVNTINHKFIPKIILSNINDITDTSNPIWLIEEYIDGLSLRNALNNEQSFSITDIVLFFETMLDILNIAEDNSIVHRDIKPENIIIDRNNNFWLIDFGISRHLDLESITSTNSPFGPCTVGYSASEQLQNRKKEIDIRADLFAIGVVSAEMIIGYNPYTHNSNDIIQTIKNIENQPLPLLRINGDTQFLMAKFIKTLGDNRISRRPRTVKEAIQLFNIVKKTLRS